MALVPDGLVGSSLAVVPSWNRLPLLGEGHHGAGVEDPEAEQVVKLKPDPVHGPVEAALGVVERVPLGGQHGQVLHVTPGQLSAVDKGYK